MKYSLPELRYPAESLAPVMSRETIDYHYGKHLQTYIDNLNRMIEGTEYEDMSLEETVCKADGGIFNNAAQTWNHIFFFDSLTADRKVMPAELEVILKDNFGSAENFKKEFSSACTGLFGSGWVWLAMDSEGKLGIYKESNAGNPMKSGLKPIFTVDVWEHAYYIDYRNRRAAYVDAIWEIVDWDVILRRIRQAK